MNKQEKGARVYFLGCGHLLDSFKAMLSEAKESTSRIVIDVDGALVQCEVLTAHLKKVIKPRSKKVIFHVKDSGTIRIATRLVSEAVRDQENREYARTKENMF